MTHAGSGPSPRRMLQIVGSLNALKHGSQILWGGHLLPGMSRDHDCCGQRRRGSTQRACINELYQRHRRGFGCKDVMVAFGYSISISSVHQTMKDVIFLARVSPLMYYKAEKTAEAGVASSTGPPGRAIVASFRS